MPETELGEVESANEALDRADWIVRPDIVLNPRRKETGLIPAIADLECAIRHKPNRTCCSRKCPPFLPSLVRQISVQPLAQKYFAFAVGQITDLTPRVPPHYRGVSRSSRTRGADAVDAAASGAQRDAGRVGERPVSDQTAR